MIRTQIQLEKEEYERLKREAARRSCSVSSLVRESVRSVLRESEADARAASIREIAGKYHSGKGDLAREHDAYLEDGW
ncbi:MAG: hypothetical protein ACP5I4_16555 [Oceanipulchritudo sp.]